MKSQLLEKYMNILHERPEPFDEFVNLSLNYLDIDNDVEHKDSRIRSIRKIDIDTYEVVIQSGKKTNTINMTKKELKTLHNDMYVVGDGFRLEIPTNEVE